MAKITDHFEKHFMPEPYSGCWLWTAAYGGKGNAIPYVRHLNKTMPAYRVAWMLYRGSIPNGLQVCHHCDTPGCVNPEHLFIGTPKDNIADCACKDRIQHGESHYNAKLSEDDIREIRASALTQKELATHYGVDPSHVSRIKTGDRGLWRRAQ
jgi:hypothetical protein